jgi:hypothetical protein
MESSLSRETSPPLSSSDSSRPPSFSASAPPESDETPDPSPEMRLVLRGALALERLGSLLAVLIDQLERHHQDELEQRQKEAVWFSPGKGR